VVRLAGSHHLHLEDAQHVAGAMLAHAQHARAKRTMP
jgi:hypothetical protein